MILKLNDQIISHDIYLADNFFKRLRGFMFYTKPHHEVLVFEPCSSIHTFFMRFDIDVVFLDAQMYVVKVVKGLGKGKVVSPVKSAVYTLEGAKGFFENVLVGDKMEMW